MCTFPMLLLTRFLARPHTHADRQHVHTLRDGPNRLHHPTLACSYIRTDRQHLDTHHTHTHTLTDLKRLFADFGSNAAAASAATGLC